MVQVLDGEAEINIGGKEIVVRTGEMVVVMPADVPHSLDARVPIKTILTVGKKPKDRLRIFKIVEQSNLVV